MQTDTIKQQQQFVRKEYSLNGFTRVKRQHSTLQRLLHEVFATKNIVKQEPHLLASTSASSLLAYPNANYLISQANWEGNQLIPRKSTMYEKMLPNYWSHTTNNFHLNSLFKKTDSISHSQLLAEWHHLCEKNAMQVFSALVSLLWKFCILDFMLVFFPNTSFPGAKPGWRGEII